MEILPIGGLDEVGKNMTAIGFGNTYVVVDMGVKLENILGFDDISIGEMSRAELINIDGIPDDTPLRKKNVVAILLTHGHLDHIGAIGKLAGEYDAPIYGTPFTIGLVRDVLQDEKTFKVTNALKVVNPGKEVDIGGIRAEFIPITHSILQTSAVAVHGPDGTVLCASDFKLDHTPTLGPASDLDRLGELSNDGPVAAMVGAVRLDDEGPTPSESHAREMLKKTMDEAMSSGKGMVVTTFSSHMARLKSIVELSYELGRTPIMLGRSLKKYCSTACNVGIVEFPPELEIHGRPNSVGKAMRRIRGRREDYVLIVTGHQGEPNSILTRIADEQLPFRIKKHDEVIFSASVIPNPLNESNRKLLETKLQIQGAHIHRDVHVSGHAGRRDTREFLDLVKPEYLIPCHATSDKMEILADMGKEAGCSEDGIHVLKNGQRVNLGG